MITPRIIQQLHEEIADMDRKSFDDFIKTLEKIYAKTHMVYCKLCEEAMQDAERDH